MPRREKPRQEQPDNDGLDDNPAMAGAEIPRKSAPLRRGVPPPRACGRDNLPCEPTRYVPDTLSRVLPPKILIEFETHAATDFSRGNNSRNFRPREQYPISYYNELFVWNQACHRQPAHFHLIAESNTSRRTSSVFQSDGWWCSVAAVERHRPATGTEPAEPSAGAASSRRVGR
jgi:hypothetical protein